MATPSPELLRPSPLDLGATLSGAFRVLRARLPKFVVIALLQGIVTGLVVSAAIAVFVFGVIASIGQRAFAPTLAWGVVAMFVAVLLAALIQIKSQAMLVLGAHDTIEGRDASIGELFARTRGVVGRVLLLVLALVGGLFAVLVLFGVLFWGVTAAALGASEPGAAIGAMVGLYILFVFLMIALGIAAIYFQVRFLYLLPALAVEDRSAIDALRRSWGLTKGNVLRTLGYYLVASFLVSAVSYVIQIIPQAILTPAAQQAENSASPGAALLALIPIFALVMVLQVAVQLVAVPFLACYITVMYVDQIRRGHLPPGQHRFPGQPSQPGQQGPWGQQGQGSQWGQQGQGGQWGPG